MNYSHFKWQNETILIADDDKYSILFLERILKKTGARVLIASDGVEAIQQIQKNTDIRMAILDILMPGLNGYEVVEESNKLSRNIIFIGYTADVIRLDRKRCSDLGFYTCLTKPTLPIRLFEILNEALISV